MEEDEEEEEEELPSQEFRVECVKLLLELDETTHAATEPNMSRRSSMGKGKKINENRICKPKGRMH
eukprot:scaffold302024_cov14-Tisochrysis_lutea.AAC.1